jgi:hypothetical protein
MKSLVWKPEPHRAMARTDATPTRREPLPTPVAPAINTILAVRDHAPGEIEELTAEIQQLHQRLGVAYARKRLLEQLLNVIREAEDTAGVTPQQGMAVIR